MLKDFAALSTGLVSLQEKGMKLSKSVDLYSDEEYPSMKASLAGVSENIASLQDFLGAQVKYMYSDRFYASFGKLHICALCPTLLNLKSHFLKPFLFPPVIKSLQFYTPLALLRIRYRYPCHEEQPCIVCYWEYSLAPSSTGKMFFYRSTRSSLWVRCKHFF